VKTIYLYVYTYCKRGNNTPTPFYRDPDKIFPVTEVNLDLAFSRDWIRFTPNPAVMKNINPERNIPTAILDPI
jgi:hypothetical protein